MTTKSDIWQLGCIILEISTGIKPFKDAQNQHVIYHKLFTQNITPYDYITRHPVNQ